LQFQVRALNAQQQLVSLVLDAADEASARLLLQQQGLTLVSLAQDRQALSIGSIRFPLLLFAQELHALLVAGLSVIESLDVLIDKEPADTTRSVLTRLAVALREGQRLSGALAQQPEVFPALFVGILQAAEGTSDLPLALSRYLDYETRLAMVRQKVVSAAIYPAILVCVGGAVAAFLLGYVVPRFATVYRGSGRPLPWASQLLLDWGGFAGAHAIELGVVLGLIVGIAVWRVRCHLRDGTWWRLLAIIPGTHPKLEVLEVSRLYLTLGMLLQGGLPIAPALHLARSVLPSARHAAVSEAARRIAEGEPLSQAFVATGLITPVALRLLKVGERSGQLGPMLVRTAEFYETETTRWIERFTKAFEPVLMAAIGLVIGLIVILLYMPIFDLAGSLQ
jgi:general secretion pathway protein F